VAHLLRTKANAVSAARVTVMAATDVNAMAKTDKTQRVMMRKLPPVQMPHSHPHPHRLLPLTPLKIAQHNAPTLSVRNKPLLVRPRQSPPRLLALLRLLFKHLLQGLSTLRRRPLRQPLWWLQSLLQLRQHQLHPLRPKHLAQVCPWSLATPCKLTT
jgi:hypothetical protein